MLRAESLRKLTHETVVKHLEKQFTPAGFKYVKGESSFKRLNGIFEQIIRISLPHEALVFNNDKEELFLCFNIHASIHISKFNKWALDVLNYRSNFQHHIKSFDGITEVDFTKLNKDDFFSPSESLQFKNAVTSWLIGPQNKKRRQLAEFEAEIPGLLNSLEKASNELYLFENRPEVYWDHLLLLVFTKHTELARQNFQSYYTKIVRSVEASLSSNNQNTRQEIQALEDFILVAKTLLDLEFTNPYKREAQPKENLQTKVKFSDNLGYTELLRLDLTMINQKSFAINDQGEILFLLNNNRIVKHNCEGKVMATWEFRYPKCFRELYNVEVKWDEASGSFFVNNMVITSDNTLLELIIDIDTQKEKKDSIYPNIIELLFDKENELFLLLFSHGKNTIFSTFNNRGELLKTTKFASNAAKINLKARQVFLFGPGNSFDLYTFEGEFVRNLEYNNGNSRVEISPDGTLILLHFYSTKSQLYDISNNKEYVLWAHPTFLKEYKELYYNDINHNFGLSKASFTPDGKYIVGGAEHGKYVAWDTEKFNRKEIIPNKESRSIFNWYTTTFSYEDGKPTNNYFTPYTVEYEGQTLFINRGYDISAIFFIDSGKHIVTQHNDSLLTWNNAFENTGFIDGIGHVTFSSQNYMAVRTETDFTLYKRVDKIDENFQSSIFREKVKVEIDQVDDKPGKPDIKIAENRIENKPKKSFFSWIFGK